MLTRIGINADSSTINGDLTLLDRLLGEFRDVGFTHVELPVHGLDCIVDSKLCIPRLVKVQRIISKYTFSYSVHAPDGLNLADKEEPEAHFNALLSSIEFASQIGANIVVYHGSYRKGPSSAVFSIQDWDEEIERLKRIAEYAERRQVVVAVENIFRQSASEVSYRISPITLAAIVNKVNSANVRICFDFGHCFISSNEEGFSIDDALQTALPYISHIHVHDNFGRPWGGNQKAIDALPLGVGDLHLLPGWGQIPFNRLLPILLATYRGIFMLEIQPRFRDLYRDVIDWVDKITDQIGSGEKY